MTDKTELLPCPFCGGDAESKQTVPPESEWFVECNECGASAPVLSGSDLGGWNTRAAPAEDVRAVRDEPVVTLEMKDSCLYLVEGQLTPGRHVLYRRPQRPVVLPERLTMKPFQTVDRGSTSYKTGYNACLDEFARLNP